MKTAKWFGLIVIVLLMFNGSSVFAGNVMTTDSYSFTVISLADEDKVPPYVDGEYPARDAVNVSSDSNISCHVNDDGIGVDINTIVMKVNGVIVIPNITGDPSDYYVEHDPGTLPNSENVNITIDASDLANN